jgi:alpha-L-fucosidase
VPPESVERLAAMGKWMAVNGDSIYGTTASPLDKLPWGRCTAKKGTLFLHVFDWPKDGKLVVPGLVAPKAARLLAGGESLTVTPGEDGGCVITVPAKAPDSVCSVIACETAK